MKFPWHKYEELPISKRNTAQIFITNACNLTCVGCFADRVMKSGTVGNFMNLADYYTLVEEAVNKGAKQINLLGGEPLLHKRIDLMCIHNASLGLKTTIYTNGLLLDRFVPGHFEGAKLRVSVDSIEHAEGSKPIYSVLDVLKKYQGNVDINYMVGGRTNLSALSQASEIAEKELGANVFFISSYRYLDDNTDFFVDSPTKLEEFLASTNPVRAMPLMAYKELVHRFLYTYSGKMEIHISKRGVFESTQSVPHNKCKFVNYLIGGKIIQCPYDLVNLKYQDSYEFDERNCQQNNTCLMSKIVVRRRDEKL